MAVSGESRTGFGFDLDVNTARAIAELRAVEAAAQRARAATAGITPQGQALGGAVAAVAVPVPGGQIIQPGDSVSNATLAPLGQVTGARQVDMPEALPVNAPDLPAKRKAESIVAGVPVAVGGSPKRSAASSVAKGGMFAGIGERLTSTNIEGGGANIGALKLAASGVAIRGVAELVGPAFGYAAVGVGTLKAADMLGDFARRSVEEASRTGQTIGDVASAAAVEAAKSVLTLAADFATALAKAGAGAVIDGSGAFYLGGALFSEGASRALASVVSGESAYRERIKTGARTLMAKVDAVKFRLGLDSQLGEFKAESNKWIDGLDAVLTETRERAATDAERLSFTLRDGGFNATPGEIQRAAMPIFRREYESQAERRFREENGDAPSLPTLYTGEDGSR